MSELVGYINSYFELGKEEAKLVASKFERLGIFKGDFFTKTDKYCSRIGFVQSGFLRIYANSDGKEITQWISTSGEFTTDLSSFMFDNPARWNIQALTDSEVYVISKTDFDRIGDVVKNWNQLEKLFLSKCFVTLEDRVHSFLSKSAEERYLELYQYKKSLFNEVPLQYLASMLGMTPETLSRIRKKTIS